MKRLEEVEEEEVEKQVGGQTGSFERNMSSSPDVLNMPPMAFKIKL